MVQTLLLFTLEALIYLCAITIAVSEGSQLKYRFCIVASDMTNSSLKTTKKKDYW